MISSLSGRGSFLEDRHLPETFPADLDGPALDVDRGHHSGPPE
jgi:hypothetical protein